MIPAGYGFANLEPLLIAYTSTIPGIGGVGTKLRATWPFLLITEIPSGGDNYLWSNKVVDLEVFHPDRGAAKDFSRLVQDHMMRLRHSYVNGVPVGEVRTINGFGWIDYQDPTLHRYLAEYEIESVVNAQPL